MAVDLVALGEAAAAVLGGAAAWRQSRRASLSASLDRVDRELKHERDQRKLLTKAYVDLLRWARKVDPGAAGPPPDPPDDLELLPWH